MAVESIGSGWRVRVRYTGLLSISVSTPDEASARELNAAITTLRKAGNTTVLRHLDQHTDHLATAVYLLRTHKPEALTLDHFQASAGTVSVSKALDEWKAFITTGLSKRQEAFSPATVENYTRVADRFKAWCIAHHIGTIDGLTKKAFLAHRSERAKAASANTANREFIALRSWWRWMSEDDGLGLSLPPWTIIPLKETTPERKGYDVAVIRKVIAAVQPAYWQAPLTLLAETGMRDAECRFIRWDDVDLEDRVLVVRPHDRRRLKSATSHRAIPLSERAVATLTPLHQDRGQEVYVFPWLTRSRWGLRQALRRACEATDTPLTLHALRHSFTVRILANGADISAVRDTLGHASIQTTDRYAREVSEAARLERVRKAL